MVYRKNRRFSRHRSNGRSHLHSLRRNDGESTRMGSNSFSNQNRSRNNFRVPQNVEKLVEKYNALAKEALSAGDRTLSENYLQHADHFTRIMAEKNLNQIQKKTVIEKTQNLKETNSDQNSLDINQELAEKNKSVIDKTKNLTEDNSEPNSLDTNPEIQKKIKSS